MRISTKGRHAVMAMVDLARHAKTKPVALAEIALRQAISLSYLEQLIAQLKGHNLVNSHRGPGGGYMLQSPPESITVHDIIIAVDNATPRVRVADPLTATGRQLTDLLWQAIGDEVSKYLKTVSLADVTNCVLCTKGEDEAGEDQAEEALDALTENLRNIEVA